MYLRMLNHALCTTPRWYLLWCGAWSRIMCCTRDGSMARRPWALARAPAQFFCNFLCKFLWISHINSYKLGNFFRFFYYLLAISYVNTYKCVANFFCPGFTIILAPPLCCTTWHDEVTISMDLTLTRLLIRR